MLKTILVLTLIALSATPAFARAGKKGNGGGAWDFEGALQDERVRLSLEATKVSVDGARCDSASLARHLVALLEDKTAAWEQFKEAAKSLSEDEKKCAIQAETQIR